MATVSPNDCINKGKTKADIEITVVMAKAVCEVMPNALAIPFIPPFTELGSDIGDSNSTSLSEEEPEFCSSYEESEA